MATRAITPATTDASAPTLRVMALHALACCPRLVYHEAAALSFRWAWDWPVLAAFYELTATAVHRAVQDFTRHRAPQLPSAKYRIVVARWSIRVRVDTKTETVLVLNVYPLR